METIKFDKCREVLTSGNVWNCIKKPVMMRAKQMFEDFEIETLEHQDVPYKGKKGDYIMISESCETYVCDKEFFEKNYEVKNGFDTRQFARSSEDYHFGLWQWCDSPFNDEALQKLRLKKVSKDIVAETDKQSGRHY